MKSQRSPKELPKMSNKMETPAVKRMNDTSRGSLTLSASQPNKRVEIKPRNAKELSRYGACCCDSPFQIIIGLKRVDIACYEAFRTAAPNARAQKLEELFHLLSGAAAPVP